jgi:CubicO group peptidase (beta-lactamase class C family)
MNPTYPKHLFLLVLILSFGCKEKESENRPIAGQVIDAYSQEPVANVRVQVLEDGPTTFTDLNGQFAFTNTDLMSQDFEEIMLEEGVGAAVRINRSGYRPRELNIEYNAHPTIKFTRDSVPAYVYYPPVQLNDGIQTADMTDIGMDRQIVQDLMDKMYTFDFAEIHSLLVYKDDRLVLEEYFYGNNDTIDFEHGVVVDERPAPIFWSRTDPHYIASVNKALTSTVVGIALDKFGVSVDAKIATYLPEYSDHFEDANKAAIDFERALTMTAGLQWDEWGQNDLALLWQSDDFADFALGRNSLGVGTEWRYNSALPNVLLKAVQNMAGEPVRTWAQDNFYGKLGITDYNWQSQPDGYPEGAARMYLRPRDMLKVGITYLNKGRWKGEQVIPEAWVQECLEVKEATESGDYSYYFWLRTLDGKTYLSADGDGGNFINVFPDENMVIVITQGNYLKWPFYVNQADNIMKNYLFRAIAD